MDFQSQYQNHLAYQTSILYQNNQHEHSGHTDPSRQGAWRWFLQYACPTASFAILPPAYQSFLLPPRFVCAHRQEDFSPLTFSRLSFFGFEASLSAAQLLFVLLSFSAQAKHLIVCGIVHPVSAIPFYCGTNVH